MHKAWCVLLLMICTAVFLAPANAAEPPKDAYINPKNAVPLEVDYAAQVRGKVNGYAQVWREPLVWAAADHHKPEEPLSLVLSPQPCIYRARALAALDKAKKPWRISYTSPSLAGTIAAVKAGLGITVLPANMLPSGIHPIRKEIKLPELADAEIALMKLDDLPKAADMLAEHIVHSLENVKV